MDIKELILVTISDLVGDFIYYDRKEDEDLSRETLAEAFRTGVVTVDEVVELFKRELTEGLS